MSDSEHAAYTNGPWYERKNVMRPDGHMFPVAIKEAMTLRDQFAMAALTGLIMRNGGLLPKIVAEDAYYIADAMLEEREIER